MAKFHYGDPSNDTREILLTFDDGPSPDTTPEVLDTLSEHGIKAVFFVVGQRLEEPGGRELMMRAYEEGHVIGNHTYSHPSLTKCSPDRIREEMHKTQELIGECRSDLLLCRAPYGAINPQVSKVLQDEGYLNLHWNVDTLDWQKKSDAWVDHSMDQIEAREDSLVLMHDVHPTTASRVGDLIRRIKSLDNGDDLRFVQYN